MIFPLVCQYDPAYRHWLKPTPGFPNGACRKVRVADAPNVSTLCVLRDSVCDAIVRNSADTRYRNIGRAISFFQKSSMKLPSKRWNITTWSTFELFRIKMFVLNLVFKVRKQQCEKLVIFFGVLCISHAATSSGANSNGECFLQTKAVSYKFNLGRDDKLWRIILFVSSWLCVLASRTSSLFYLWWKKTQTKRIG